MIVRISIVLCALMADGKRAQSARVIIVDIIHHAGLAWTTELHTRYQTTRLAPTYVICYLLATDYYGWVVCGMLMWY